MTRIIRMKDIAGLKANATTAPYATTEPAKIGGVRGNTPVDPPPSQGLIFSETFDSLPDYTSANELPQGILDAGWTQRRHGEVNFSPSTGYPNHHDAFEINGVDPDKRRGATGKSFIAWRESYNPGWNQYNSDGILSKLFDNDYQEMFVRYWIKFQPGWTNAGQSKIVRFRSFDRGGDLNNRFYKFFTDGHTSALFQTQYGYSQYGLRNFLSLRGDPQESNYYFGSPSIPSLPRAMQQGDLALNFDNHVRDLNGDGTDDNTVTLIDRLTGAVITPGQKEHDNIYGTEWNKFELYAKMNSAPGEQDGIAMEWVNDQLCFKNENVAWMGTESPGGVGWNTVDIGGNDFFNEYPNEQAVEEWYAIDSVEVYDSLPEDMQ